MYRDTSPLRAKRLLTPVLGAVALVCGTPAMAASCADMVGTQLPNTTITLAQDYPAGSVVVGTTVAPVELCRIAGTIVPGPRSNVHFEVWVPTDGSWIGKYEQVGNGGFAGSIQYSAVANGVSRGYASASTDDGTSGPPSGAPAFINNNDVLLDYGYRAIKSTSDDSKALVTALTGSAPSRSYFVGCSDGGREALIEAQRYPDDFDGIIVGSPVNDQVGEFGSSYLYDMQVTLGGDRHEGVPDAYLTSAQLSVLSNAVLAKCGGLDGGVSTDAFLSDPRQCHFDPVSLRCAAGQDPTTCLSQPQITAVKKIYYGPHDLYGTLLFPGYEPGGESASGDWASWISGTSPATPGSQYGLGYGFGCDLMLNTTTCSYLDIRLLQQDRAARIKTQPITSAIDPDLSAFRAHGGRMIQYAGWADTAIAPENGLNYYRKVDQTIGDPRDFYRVFMVPGMAHCSGGAGPNAFGNGNFNGPVIDAQHDLLKALEAWVEQGQAPKTIVATHYVNNDATQGVQFQRPLCVFPQRGEYDGVGDPNQAASFRCVDHGDQSDPRNLGPQRAYQ